MNDFARVKYLVIPQTVCVRKHSVDIEKLKKVLKEHKTESNKFYAEKLNVPLTKVEHWFRSDIFFAIPDENIWYELKELLKIQTDEFDKAITEFEFRDGVFDKNERYYLSSYIAPTLTTLCENEKFVVRVK